MSNPEVEPGDRDSARYQMPTIAWDPLRHTQLPRDLQPTVATTVMLWWSSAVMLGFALY